MKLVSEVAPEAVPLPRATAVFGISRSSLYRLAGEGAVRFIKLGRTTLVDANSVRAFLAAQPSAVIRPERKAA
ncbi:helix-turn-helix transcriptional regulator [Falsiroseomonas sp. E2-1-a20]|uniref:helix-turn-helix transcriptional regulator n=1 Tax=Falsiroseomonas sp. E2-1-a20 TaxID=3239300 RepID=UPI003F313093